MSRSLMYAPDKPGTCIGKGNMIDQLEKLFDHLPQALHSAHIQGLEVAQKLCSSEEMRGEYQAIIDAIERHETIRIWVEY